MRKSGDDQIHLLLTEDAVYDVSAYGMDAVHGLDAIIRLFAQRPGRQPVGHHVTNVMISTSDVDTAIVRSKGLAVMADGTSGTVVYDDVEPRAAGGSPTAPSFRPTATEPSQSNTQPARYGPRNANPTAASRRDTWRY